MLSPNNDETVSSGSDSPVTRTVAKAHKGSRAYPHWRIGSLVGMPVRLLVGRDVFISYSRRDGSDYAKSLVQALEKAPRGVRLTCYLDQREAQMDEHLPNEARRGLGWASMLVVVASPEAAKSQNVALEISLFERTHRQVIVLSCESSNLPNDDLVCFIENLQKRGAVIIRVYPK